MAKVKPNSHDQSEAGRISRKLDNVRGPLVTNTAYGIVVGAPARVSRALPSAPAKKYVVPLMLTGTASGGGRYTVQTYLPTGTLSVTSNFSASDLGNTGPVGYGFNPLEIGTATHGLDTTGASNPLYFVGLFLGNCAADGKPCYLLIEPLQIVQCNSSNGSTGSTPSGATYLMAITFGAA